MLDKDDSCLKWDGAEGAGWLKFHCATQNSHNLKLCCAGASRQSQSGPENVHGGAEKGNYSKRLQRWGREVQTRLHRGTQSDTNFIQHLIFIQNSVRKTRQLTFSLLTYTSYKQSQEILRAWEWHPVILTPDNISLCMRSLHRTPGVCSK